MSAPTPEHPPRNGEGDRAQRGGGVLRQPLRTVRLARFLRRRMTPPEVALWTALRKRPGGFKFRRQCPIGPYVLDFACLSKRLAIEVDGEAHNRADRPAKDALRDAFLGEQGFKTIRFAASDVMNEMQAVVDAIMAECLVREPLHHPSDGPPPRTGEDEF